MKGNVSPLKAKLSKRKVSPRCLELSGGVAADSCSSERKRRSRRMDGWMVDRDAVCPQTWLSEVEGKQSSRGDRRHSADNHQQHTPQGRER